MFKKIRDVFQTYKLLKEKDWSSQWLRMQEKNLLAQGGVNITEPARQSYLVQKCVNLISQNAPQAPLELWRGDEKLPDEHPLNKLFNFPNDTMTKYDLISATSAYFTLYGEAFWVLVSSVGQMAGTTNVPAEILLADPRGMKEVTDEKGNLLGWEFGKEISFKKDEIIQFKNVNPYNAYRGLSPLDAVDLEIKSDVKAGEYQEKFFTNGAVPSLVLQTAEGDTSTVAELRKLVRLWENRHKSSRNAHKIGVLRGGMTFQDVGLTQQEMDFINSRQMTRDIILSIFGVPKTVAGFTEELNRATSEVQKRLFWQESIKPQLIRIQNKITRDLTNIVEPGVEARFDFLQIDELQRNYTEEVEVANKLFLMGFSRNELNERFALGFDTDTEHGDEKYVPLNLLSVTDENFGFGAEPETLSVQDPNIKLVEKVVEESKISRRNARIRQNFIRNQSKYEKIFRGKLKKHLFSQRITVLQSIDGEKANTSEELIGRISIFDEQDGKLRAIITPILNDTIQTAGDMVHQILGIDRPYILNQDVLFKRVNRIKGVHQTIFNQLKKEIHEGIRSGEGLDEIKKRIKKVYNFADKRADLIARTETAATMSEATMLEYQANGVERHEWLTAGDDNVRPEHQGNSGQQVVVGQPFPSGETYPGENSPGCRCSLAPVIGV